VLFSPAAEARIVKVAAAAREFRTLFVSEQRIGALIVRSSRTSKRILAQTLSAALALLLLLPGTASASDWKVVAGKSWLGFTGAASGIPFEGRFSRWGAQISIDPGKPEAGHVAVTVDMASAVTGDRERDQALPQAAWFDAKAFPHATLMVQSFRAKGGHDYDAIGTLALRGVTEPIVMPVTIDVEGNTLHATGHLELIRTDYGVG
jgi:polyisoprenoid-binding protein YceI